MDSESQKTRFMTLDIAKGIAALLMLLGHAEIFLNRQAYQPFVFRDGAYFEIKHLYNFWLYNIQSSVDAFYFLSGVSLVIGSRRSGLSTEEFAHKLRKRSLFLVVIDLTVISWCYGRSWTTFIPTFSSIATFGLSFFIMSFLSRWSARRMFTAAMVVLLIREVLPLHQPSDVHSLWGALYGMTWSPIFTEKWRTLFTLFSWLPIIMLGHAFGDLLQKSKQLLQPGYLALTSLSLLALFFFCRCFVSFGSLGQPMPTNMVQIFQLEKYPASMHFHLLNLSYNFAYLLIGSLCERYVPRSFIAKNLSLLGKHIFFVYIAHLLLFAVFKNFGVAKLFENMNQAAILGFIVAVPMVLYITHKFDRLKRVYRDQFWLLRYI